MVSNNLRELMRLALDPHACLHACTGDLASTLVFALGSADTPDKGVIAVLRALNAVAARGATASLTSLLRETGDRRCAHKL